MTSTTQMEQEFAEQEQLGVEEDRQAISTTNTPHNLVVQHLQHQLANAIVLYLNYTTYGWQAEGHEFFSLRMAFAEFAQTTKTIFDRLGERLRMIGQDPDIELETLIETSAVKQARLGTSLRDLLRAADDNAVVVIREIRDAVRDLRKTEEDPGSIDLLISVLKVHEQHEWFLRELNKTPGNKSSF